MAYAELVQAATSQKMLSAFPDLEELENRPSSASSGNTTASHKDEEIFAGHDQEQIRLMEEACICVDWNDKPYAAGSKKTLHLMESIRQGLLHRAFSVFMFNDKDELLLQQRASEKITFPDLWTNTCCSHPLAVGSEMGRTVSESGNLDVAIVGVKQAAIRKLDHELGIASKYVPIENFAFITRIHYMAPSSGHWGEHEVDYILFVRANPEVKASPNEVRDWQWVSKSKLEQMFADESNHFTPWFKLICENFLFKWWGQTPKPDHEIHRML